MQNELCNLKHDDTTAFRSESLVSGSFHQAEDRLSVQSRGSQCTTNALCALIYAQYFELSSGKTLDEVLIQGGQLYKSVVNNL